MDELMEVNENNRIQYIVVLIGSENYGIDIKYVDNIVRMQKITRVPKAQHYFRGVINLRGEIVPVMSVRRKMDLGEDEFTKDSRIIILKIEEHGNLGIVVDAVREVVTLGPDEIEHNNNRDVSNTFINGIGKNGEQLISLFDINKIIEDKENSQS